MAGKKDKVKDEDRFSVLVPDLEHCFLCGTTQGVCIHEVFFGSANRKISKEDGMTVGLCKEHHQGQFGVHNNKAFDTKLKQQAEKIWIEKYADGNLENGIELFIKRYGRNYLD